MLITLYIVVDIFIMITTIIRLLLSLCEIDWILNINFAVGGKRSEDCVRLLFVKYSLIAGYGKARNGSARSNCTYTREFDVIPATGTPRKNVCACTKL